MIFGFAFLNSQEVEDAFVEDFMSVAPKDDRCSAFADYLTYNCITPESKFPPVLWAEEPSNSRRTNNGPE